VTVCEQVFYENILHGSRENVHIFYDDFVKSAVTGGPATVLKIWIKESP